MPVTSHIGMRNGYRTVSMLRCRYDISLIKLCQLLEL